MMHQHSSKSLVRPINAQAGDLLKVSDFVNNGTVDGSWQTGTAAYEKRGVEAFVPKWNPDNCIQCNKCAYVLPSRSYPSVCS
jgi:pyruvate-ferredoxin/flavodoxin oxidoreductase